MRLRPWLAGMALTALGTLLYVSSAATWWLPRPFPG
jgi:hypothetical protein